MYSVVLDAMPSSFAVRTPVFSLVYQNVDITADLLPLCESITYTDVLEGESDTVEITLDNPELIWMSDWLPSKGDKIELTLGYLGEARLGPVQFEIDTMEADGPPDVFQIKGLATPPSKTLRELRNEAYENTTLEEVAQKIATRQGLELVADKIKDVKIPRATQKFQSDLDFLKTEAAKYGCIFKVESTKKLVFYQESDLEAAETIYVLEAKSLSSYRFQDGQQDTVSRSTVAYQDPQSGQLNTHTTTANPQQQTASDALKINKVASTPQQAVIQSEESLRRANKGEVKGTLSLEGTPQLSAGSNVKVEAFGKYSGKYQLKKVIHSLTRSQGYKTECDVERLEPVDRG